MHVRLWLFSFITFVCTTLTVSAAPDIYDIINQVSLPQYKTYLKTIEDCGLGLYGGPAYNNGSRSRKWAISPNKGNLEAQIYIRDRFLENPALIVEQPVGFYSNVIATLPGVDPAKKDNIYIISGHMDTTGDVDRPGGDDNASGSAAVIEAARIMSKFRFKSTIKFITFNAEEGLHGGSLDYVANMTPAEKLKTKVINMDMIIHPRHDGNPSATWDIDLWSDLDQPAIVAWMNKYKQAANLYVPELTVDASYDDRASSDHESFYLQQIPAFTLIEFAVSEWLNPPKANQEYHTSKDYSLNEPNGAGNGYLEDLHWSYPFAVAVTKSVMATIAQEAELVPIGDAKAVDLTANSANITWLTGIPGTSRVEYGLTSALGKSTLQSGFLVENHSVVLENLLPGTQYFVKVYSADAPGQPEYASEVFSFRTVKLPAISDVTVTNLTSSSATINWKTDTVATSRALFGLTTNYSSSSIINNTPVTEHYRNIGSMMAGQIYNFVVVSGNGAGTTTSPNFQIKMPSTASDVIVDNTDPGFSTTLGTWTAGSAGGVPKIGTNYLYATSTGSLLESSITTMCRWTPNLPQAGFYDVYAYYQQGTNRTTSAPYKVIYDGGNLENRQNQYATSAAGNWYLLGSLLNFASGSSGYVQLANNAGDTAIVSADAAKWVFRGAFDTTAPSYLSISVNSKYVPAGSSFGATWWAFDGESGIAGYEYRVVDESDAQIVGWTNSGTSATHSGAVAGKTYYFDVRATNGQGIASSTFRSSGIVVTPEAGTVMQAKSGVLNSAYVIEPAVITANWGNLLYLQSHDEFVALRANTASLIPTNTVVRAAGVLKMIGGELVLDSAEVTPSEQTANVVPVKINTRSLGGAPLAGLTTTLNKPYGANNVGLFVEMSGIVTQSNQGDEYFILQDDSMPEETLKVYTGTWEKPTAGVRINVWGISTLIDSGGTLIRALTMQQPGAYEILLP